MGKSHQLELVQTKEGRYGGTYVHPRIAINLAQWLSPKFDVFVSGLVFDWMSKKSHQHQGKIKYINDTKERLASIPITKNLNDVIKIKLSQDPQLIYLHVEEKIHKAITR